MRTILAATIAVTAGLSLGGPSSGNRTIYVATCGKPGVAGTEQAPLASLAEAIERARPGDLIRVAAGTYTESQTIRLHKNGTSRMPLRIEAASGQRPVLDFAAQPEDKGHSRGLEISGDYWHVVGIEVAHAGGYGFLITGAHNRLDHCVARENRLTGIALESGASHTLVTSCDSVRNFDPKTHGEDADGFAAKHQVGPGNVFRGCRAYLNADDGWDLWMAPHPIVVEDCVAFRNGFNIFGIADFQGDGNGFKLGGNYIDAGHVLRRNVAIEQPLNGIDQNHNLGPHVVEDNLAVRCGRGFSFPESARNGSIILRNNTAIGSQNVFEPQLMSESNRWIADVPPGTLGPPPRLGHRDVPGAGPVPSRQDPPFYTPAPTSIAPPPVPLRQPDPSAPDLPTMIPPNAGAGSR